MSKKIWNGKIEKDEFIQLQEASAQVMGLRKEAVDKPEVEKIQQALKKSKNYQMIRIRIAEFAEQVDKITRSEQTGVEESFVSPNEMGFDYAGNIPISSMDEEIMFKCKVVGMDMMDSEDYLYIINCFVDENELVENEVTDKELVSNGMCVFYHLTVNDEVFEGITDMDGTADIEEWLNQWYDEY
jgi:hypothetical protein